MALKFYASVRMDIRRIQAIKQGSDVIGNRTRVTVRKNKVAAPFKVAEFDIMYNEGVSTQGTCWTWASSSTSSKSGVHSIALAISVWARAGKTPRSFSATQRISPRRIDGEIRERAGLPVSNAPQEEDVDTAVQDGDGGEKTQKRLLAAA